MLTTKKTILACCVASMGLLSSTSTFAEETETRIAALEQQLEQLKSEMAQKQAGSDDGSYRKIGGAIGATYAYKEFDEAQKDRGGDLDFEFFRLDVDGYDGNLIYSAQYRWYEYMDVIHHMYVGYNLDDKQTLLFGLTKVPFGILGYPSQNFFLTTSAYLGLEDDYDMGVNYVYRGERLDFDLAFYKSDEKGGNERFSYDIVGLKLNDDSQLETSMNEGNTVNLRVAYDVIADNDLNVELGASAQFGQLEGDSDNLGEHNAYSVHSVVDYNRWKLQLQYNTYEYDLDDYDVDSVVVGAFAGYEVIPAEADTYSVSLAYKLPVNWKMIDSLTFYNDYSAVTDKSTNTDDTRFNATGVLLVAGGLEIYTDYYIAENQPFIGGSYVTNTDGKQKRFNVNIRYYF